MRTALAVLCWAAAALLPPHATLAMKPTSAERPRVVVFFEPGFPAVDAGAPDLGAIRAALGAFDLSVAGANQLPAAVHDKAVAVVVLPFGSAFPQTAWPAIQAFLARGGSLVNVGGVPFAQPVAGEAATWRLLRRTTTYHKQLGIVQAFPVDASGLVYRDAPGLVHGGDDLLPREAPSRRIYELIVRFTTSKSFPDEDGSDGPREARLDPLVRAYRPSPVSETSVPGPAVAAPFVQIDRLEGPYAGGRWMLATGDGVVSPAAIATLVQRAARGPVSLGVQPRFAGFHPGEPITASVVFHRPRRELSTAEAACVVTVTNASGDDVERVSTRLAVAGTRATGEVAIPVDSRTLPRGRYTVTVAVDGIKAVNGFWLYDAEMLRGGRALTAARDYFERDGAPFPVTGTTYMSTDVHRRFLLEPNPAAWASDFVQMAAAGVNTIRTGIWTGWGLHASDDGTPREAVLRALEVFVLTARAHDMPVIFNLFAFVPPTWAAGRVNPYFAPAALAAERRFAGGLAARLSTANDIVWDLINEPSFSSPERLWSCRPNYDADEQAAWEAWIRETAGPLAASTPLEATVLDRWNAPPADGLALPALADFGDKNLFGATRPNKAADYKRFAQAAFTRWVRDISAAIRANGNPAQLITVGQDEGGAVERPNPLVFGEAVDFTGTHTWWFNDALLWDALVSKRPDKPSLVGETGLMTYERPDGDAWRNEVEAHNLLERKLALAFAGGGAGFVQWLWNTNVYMPIDNEAGIGLLRADGTAKPEFHAFTRLAAFIGRHRALFRQRQLEDVVVVVPQSQLFSVRDFATAATQRSVSTLEYSLGVPVRVLSEHAIEHLRKGAPLVIVPSPRVLTDAAWQALLAAADAGATVLVTGPVDRDEYERPTERLAALGLRTTTRPVAPVNSLKVADVQVSVPFRGSKLERLERGIVALSGGGEVDARVATLHRLQRGRGWLIWCPLPVELADDDAAAVAVYRDAALTARVSGYPIAKPGGVLVRPLVFETATLFVIVNETDTDVTVALSPSRGTRPGASVSVAADRALMVLVDRRTGQIVDTSR